jgi:hypothetical protein
MPTERIALNEASAEAKARRAAKAIGLVASKTRWARGTIRNLGGFRIVDPDRNMIVAGENYELNADEVVTFCQQED